MSVLQQVEVETNVLLCFSLRRFTYLIFRILIGWSHKWFATHEPLAGPAVTSGPSGTRPPSPTPAGGPDLFWGTSHPNRSPIRRSEETSDSELILGRAGSQGSRNTGVRGGSGWGGPVSPRESKSPQCSWKIDLPSLHTYIHTHSICGLICLLNTHSHTHTLFALRSEYN